MHFFSNDRLKTLKYNPKKKTLKYSILSNRIKIKIKISTYNNNTQILF